MMHDALQRLLWVTPIILQAIIVISMLLRGLYRHLPYFFTYTAFVVLDNTALFAVYKDKKVYFYAFGLGDVISWVLGIAVIYEIYAKLLKDYAVLQRLGRLLFWIIGAVLVLIALWTAFSTPVSDQNRVLQTLLTRIFQTLLTMERSTRIVQGGLLIFLFLFASFFGLSWKNYLFGIALGFAIFVCAELAVVAIRAYSGAGQNPLYVWLKSGSYNLGVLVWTFYIVRPWRGPDLPTLPKSTLAEWNEALRELLHR